MFTRTLFRFPVTFITTFAIVCLSFSPYAYAGRLSFAVAGQFDDGLIRPEYSKRFSPQKAMALDVTGFLKNARLYLGVETQEHLDESVPEYPESSQAFYNIRGNSAPDHPINWTAYLLQRLFPSPEGDNLVAGQRPDADPLRVFTPAVVGAVLDFIRDFDRQPVTSEQLQATIQQYLPEEQESQALHNFADALIHALNEQAEREVGNNLVYPYGFIENALFAFAAQTAAEGENPFEEMRSFYDNMPNVAVENWQPQNEFSREGFNEIFHRLKKGIFDITPRERFQALYSLPFIAPDTVVGEVSVFGVMEPYALHLLRKELPEEGTEPGDWFSPGIMWIVSEYTQWTVFAQYKVGMIFPLYRHLTNISQLKNEDVCRTFLSKLLITKKRLPSSTALKIIHLLGYEDLLLYRINLFEALPPYCIERTNAYLQVMDEDTSQFTVHPRVIQRRDEILAELEDPDYLLKCLTGSKYPEKIFQDLLNKLSDLDEGQTLALLYAMASADKYPRDLWESVFRKYGDVFKDGEGKVDHIRFMKYIPSTGLKIPLVAQLFSSSSIDVLTYFLENGYLTRALVLDSLFPNLEYPMAQLRSSFPKFTLLCRDFNITKDEIRAVSPHLLCWLFTSKLGTEQEYIEIIKTLNLTKEDFLQPIQDDVREYTCILHSMYLSPRLKEGARFITEWINDPEVTFKAKVISLSTLSEEEFLAFFSELLSEAQNDENFDTLFQHIDSMHPSNKIVQAMVKMVEYKGTPRKVKTDAWFEICQYEAYNIANGREEEDRYLFVLSSELINSTLKEMSEETLDKISQRLFSIVMCFAIYSGDPLLKNQLLEAFYRHPSTSLVSGKVRSWFMKCIGPEETDSETRKRVLDKLWDCVERGVRTYRAAKMLIRCEVEEGNYEKTLWNLVTESSPRTTYVDEDGKILQDTSTDICRALLSSAKDVQRKENVVNWLVEQATKEENPIAFRGYCLRALLEAKRSEINDKILDLCSSLLKQASPENSTHRFLMIDLLEKLVGLEEVDRMDELIPLFRNWFIFSLDHIEADIDRILGPDLGKPGSETMVGLTECDTAMASLPPSEVNEISRFMNPESESNNPFLQEGPEELGSGSTWSQSSHSTLFLSSVGNISLPEERKIDKYSVHILGSFLSDCEGDHVDRVCDIIKRILSKGKLEEDALTNLVEFVVEKLGQDHDRAQELIHLSLDNEILQNHQKLLEKAEEDVEHSPLPEELSDGRLVTFNEDTFQRLRTRLSAPLVKHGEMVALAEQLAKEVDECPKAEAAYDEFIAVGAPPVEELVAKTHDSYFKARLDMNMATEPCKNVDIVSYQLRQIIVRARELARDWKGKGEEGLSPVSRFMAQFLMNVMRCHTNKKNGIDLTYRMLEPTAGRMVSEEKMQKEQQKIESVELILNQMREMKVATLDGEGPVVKALLFPDGDVEEINEPPHQGEYVQCLLGGVIGLFFEGQPIPLDFNNSSVSNNLRTYTRQQVLNEFYKHFPIQKIIDHYHDQFNEDEGAWGALMMALSNENHDLVQDERYCIIDKHLILVGWTHLGVVEALLRLGILRPFYGPLNQQEMVAPRVLPEDGASKGKEEIGIV